jgi:H+/Cl- antiporter ClcA
MLGVMLREWARRAYDYVTYDWLTTLILAIGVLLVLGVSFGGGGSGAVMITTLCIGLVMGIMVAARQKSLTDREKQRPKRKRR